MSIYDFLSLVAVVLIWMLLALFSPFLAVYMTLPLVIVVLVIVIRALRWM